MNMTERMRGEIVLPWRTALRGKDSQCYEEKMQRALRVNKVPLIDQVAKIRATLSGHPLSKVPESVKLAKDAFKTLRSRYGDEERVLALRLKELKKSGDRPPSPMAQDHLDQTSPGSMQ